jgi:hypothetical protein
MVGGCGVHGSHPLTSAHLDHWIQPSQRIIWLLTHVSAALLAELLLGVLSSGETHHWL